MTCFQTRFVVNTAISTVGGVIVSTVALPFVAGVITLLYIDRRMRKEGLDITLAQQRASESASGHVTGQ